MSQETKVKVEGMTCQHCVASVREALEEVDGVEQAEVSLEGGFAKVRHAAHVATGDLVKSIEEAGFTAGAVL
jgi:copper chaperone CopZ